MAPSLWLLRQAMSPLIDHLHDLPCTPMSSQVVTSHSSKITHPHPHSIGQHLVQSPKSFVQAIKKASHTHKLPQPPTSSPSFTSLSPSCPHHFLLTCTQRRMPHGEWGGMMLNLTTLHSWDVGSLGVSHAGVFKLVTIR